MTIDKELFIPFIIFFILFFLNRQFRFKYSHIFEKSIGLFLVIWYTLIDIKYGIAFGIIYMVYLMRWRDVELYEGLENNNKDVEFIIDEPKEPITTYKKYTAIIIEPRNHKALEFVLNNFMENLSDDWGFIIFHSNTNKKTVENIMEEPLAKYKNKTTLINLNVDSKDFTIKEYSTLFYHENFYKYIPTETFLVFQTDSMILKENKDKIYDFLEYDYVGAPWPKTMGILGKMQVGNGGLSLRKKSKMLELLKYKDKGINTQYPKLYGKYIAEDWFFNGYFVKDVTVYKPSFEKAKEFSIESIYYERPFGIHKCWSGLNNHQLHILKNKYPGMNELIKLNMQNLENLENIEPKKEKKIAVITSIYGNYDNLKEHNILNKDKVDWYCFTDGNIESNFWKIVKTPYHMNYPGNINYNNYRNYYSNIKDNKTKNMMRAKFYKIKTHEIDILGKYDYFIWIDGSIILQNDFINNILSIINTNNNKLINFKHSQRNNIKDELNISLKLPKYSNQNLRYQYDEYIKKDFPDNIGLFENTIIIRKNDSEINNLFNDWWIENLKYSFQDQISYPYVLWKNNILPDYVINENVFNNKKYSYVDYNLMKNH